MKKPRENRRYCFTITEILRKSAYYGFVSNRAEMNLSGDLQVNNYGNIEEDVADFIEQYKNGKITDFS